ncbi:MAG: hypothetical protein H0T62_02765 [Parachlamydiaceae bacterium]|nr:hypothetical protein [Parachlamydiaceae bacterium]
MDLNFGDLKLTAQCDNEYFVWMKKFDLFSRILQLMENKDDKQFPPIPLSKNEAQTEVLYVKNSLKDFPKCILSKIANPKTIFLDIEKVPHFSIGSGKEYNKIQLLEAI